jgi:D-lactate dehydrogenase (cytochrome)
MAVPAEALEPTLAMYHRDLEAGGFEHVLFGHIGDSHIHANILPRSEEEYRRGRELAERWAEQATASGGTISAEHGVGKLKVELLRKMYGSDSIGQIRRLIELFNPGRRLNRGNMIG